VFESNGHGVREHEFVIKDSGAKLIVCDKVTITTTVTPSHHDTLIVCDKIHRNQHSITP
jgi:hypothetical protein